MNWNNLNIVNQNQPIFKYSTFVKWMDDQSQGINPYKIVYSDKQLSYIKLNLARMHRLDKVVVLDETQQNSFHARISNSSMKWLVITEPWCGDSAQSLPVIYKISVEWNISLTILLRDQNPALIEKYHTNGSHAIPKLIAFNEKQEEVFVWGPRPASVQTLMLDWKQNPQSTKNDLETSIHTRYARDKSKSIQYEILQLFTKSSPANRNFYDAVPIR